MSGEEIVIVGLCLFIGYWAVSKYLDSKEKPQQQQKANDKSTRDELPPRGNNYEEPKPEIEQWWEVLEVDRSATVEQIQVAYKNMIQLYHPDKVNNLGEELRKLAEEKSKAINVAYQIGLKARGQ